MSELIIELDMNRNKIFGIKSPIIWRRDKNKNSISPICYIRMAKHADVVEFNRVLESLGFDVKGGKIDE